MSLLFEFDISNEYDILSEKIIAMSNDIVMKYDKTRLNDNGRIVIPAGIRQELGLRPGDTLLLSVEGGVLKIESQQARIRRVQQSLRKFIPPDRVLSDELVTERDDEAQREMEEWLG
jgi:AbrB family looped-hinge helix DNA binding protein